MQELTDILRKATACIEAGYFHLNIDGGDPVYRERVYCYELYHQMRLKWPAMNPFYLNGEIDKAAHPILQKLGAAHAKPDLLVHRPGYMIGNYAVIEVKSCRAQNDGIRSDLEKLALFITKVRYKRAIYLIYGYEAEEMIDRVLKIALRLKVLARIELWLHKQPGQSAVVSQMMG